MNLRRTFVLSIALTFIFAAYAVAQEGLAAKDAEAVKTILETYRAAWLKNDEKTILSLFADNATLYPNGNKPVKGKAEIAKFWFAPSDTMTTINSFEIKTEEINGDRNFAVLTGANELRWTTEKRDKSESKQYVSKGYFTTVYTKRGKEWKILSQFWNAKTEEIK